MNDIEFKLQHEYIELIKLLKITRVAMTGGHARLLVEQGQVLRNGEKEFRKRAKIVSGEVIESEGKRITVK